VGKIERMKNTTVHTQRTAMGEGLFSCPVCNLLVGPAPSGSNRRVRCPRCKARLHNRKPNSIHRTWALVIAALIFYIPANILPVTVTTYMGSTQSDTIMSGVIFFMQTGSWGIAGIIFIASIIVPITKLALLCGLLLSIHGHMRWRPKERTRLYRITELVGRWSMLDVFVVTVLVALVRLGYMTTIEAGPGVVYFAAVVVITMFAAMALDPRLIWDAMEGDNERTDD
jgi:paraquat-inducible protein A